MSIEIGSKWVKDGKVVEVFEDCVSSWRRCIWFKHITETDYTHILTERDFLEQYKPYEPTYEYRYACEINGGYLYIDGAFLTDEEALKYHEDKQYQRLDFTKRERKCTH